MDRRLTPNFVRHLRSENTGFNVNLSTGNSTNLAISYFKQQLPVFFYVLEQLLIETTQILSLVWCVPRLFELYPLHNQDYLILI